MGDAKNDTIDAAAKEKVRIAAFDFDGTCISANSPVLLVHYLAWKQLLSVETIRKISSWAMRYKFHLSQDESYVRRLVFSVFKGTSASYVDAFLYKFYEDKIKSKIRPKAVERMREHHEQGDFVIIVSATFEPILIRAMQDIPFENEISTRMVVDCRGRYTNRVDGLPCEGEEKVRALSRYADERFGEGNWELSYAYGDHYSDSYILDAALHPCAVTPSGTLRRYAKQKGYEILDWS